MPIYDATPDNPNPRLGFVYVLTSPAMPGLVKVGATRKHPIQRVKELSAGTGVPVEFTLAYYRDFADCFLAETLLHEAFADQRVNNSCEFFEATVAEVIQVVQHLTDNEAYQEGIESAGLTGGTAIEPPRRLRNQVATPFAELFLSFPDDGSPRELDANERAKCRNLERSLSSR